MLAVVFILTALCLSSPNQSRAADTPENELFLVAEKAFEDGFYDVALRYIDQFQQKYPDSQKKVQIKLLLGQCYFFKNQYLKAFEIFQSLTQYTEFRDATLFWLGETYFKGGDYKQAEKNYQQLINTYPHSSYIPQGLYSLGWTAFEQGHYKEAQASFHKLISGFPNHQLSEEATFKVGECSHNLEEHEATTKIFQDYLSLYPKSSRQGEANFFIAEAYYAQENYLLAISFYAQASEKAYDPKLSVLAKLGMGWSYLKLHKYDLAQKNFEEADQLSKAKNIPTENILFGFASLYTEAGENEKASTAYLQIIGQFPNSPRLAEAYLGRANAAYAAKDYTNAIGGYQNVIEHFGNDPSQAGIIEKAYYGLAWTYLKAGRTDQAIESFQNIVNKSNSKIAKASALTQIGDAYQEVEQLDKAVAVYDQILREYPDGIYADYAQFRLGVALLKQEKFDAATLSFQTLQANFPKSKYLSDVKYYLGLAYFKKEEWEPSIEIVKTYLSGSEEDKTFLAEANYLLGLSYFNLKKYDQAISAFQKIIKNFQQQKAMVQMAELYTAKSYFAIGKTKEANERFTDIIKQYPKTEAAAETLLWLGDHAFDDENYPAAIQSYEQFVQSYPGHEKLSLVYFALGQSYQSLGKFEQALNNFKQISETPNKEIFAKAKLAIADIFSRDVEPSKAVETYRNIAHTVPEFKKEALLRIAGIYRNNKDYQKAIDTYQEILTTIGTAGPGDAAALLFEVADTYEFLQDSTKAVETYLKISYLYPEEKEWVIKSYLRLARIFEDSSQWEQAATIYNKVIVFNTAESKYAQERLEWIAANTAVKNSSAQ